MERVTTALQWLWMSNNDGKRGSDLESAIARNPILRVCGKPMKRHTHCPAPVLEPTSPPPSSSSSSILVLVRMTCLRRTRPQTVQRRATVWLHRPNRLSPFLYQTASLPSSLSSKFLPRFFFNVPQCYVSLDQERTFGQQPEL